MGNKEYGNESIRALKETEKVRSKPAVIFGTDGRDGTLHSIFEILSNSIDEARAGYGNVVNVTVHKDNSWTVQDFGRGVPMAYNKKEKKENYKLIFETLYAGGKYEDDDTYKYSLGTNGLGATATNFGSSWFKVESKRDGKIYTVGYKEGIESEKFKEVNDKDGKKQKTGTTISWLPDLKVFTDIVIPKEVIVDTLKAQAIVNKGLTIHFKDEREGYKEDFCYQEGVLGYAKSLITKEDAIIEPISFECEGKGRDRSDKKDYKVKGEIVIYFNNKLNTAEYYHNSSFLRNGGSPKKAKENALLNFFGSEIKKKGLSQHKVEFDDIGDSLIFISNTFSSYTSYEGQTKYAIDNKFIQDFLTEQIEKHLKDWAKKSPLDFDKVCKEISDNAEARVSAGTQKQLTKQKLSGKIKLDDRIKKYIDCRSKDNNVAEFIIAEGDSAIGSLKAARDAEFQALLPIRGKILNVLKCDYGTIFKNELIMDIMKIVGTGIQMSGGKKNSLGEFNIENRRFKKILICCDEDDDGYHIRSLLTTMFWKLTPELIKQGYIYYLRTPFFEIEVSSGQDKGKMYYTFTEEEKNEIVKKYSEKNLKLQRNKGIGALNATTLHKFMMPETRKEIKITMNDVKACEKTLELWMGNDSEPRQEYMKEHGAEYEVEE